MITKSIPQIKTLKDAEDWLQELSSDIYHKRISPEHGCTLLTTYTKHLVTIRKEDRDKLITEYQINEFQRHDN